MYVTAIIDLSAILVSLLLCIFILVRGLVDRARVFFFAFALLSLVTAIFHLLSNIATDPDLATTFAQLFMVFFTFSVATLAFTFLRLRFAKSPWHLTLFIFAVIFAAGQWLRVPTFQPSALGRVFTFAQLSFTSIVLFGMACYCVSMLCAYQITKRLANPFYKTRFFIITLGLEAGLLIVGVSPILARLQLQPLDFTTLGLAFSNAIMWGGFSLERLPGHHLRYSRLGDQTVIGMAVVFFLAMAMLVLPAPAASAYSVVMPILVLSLGAWFLARAWSFLEADRPMLAALFVYLILLALARVALAFTSSPPPVSSAATWLWMLAYLPLVISSAIFIRGAARHRFLLGEYASLVPLFILWGLSSVTLVALIGTWSLSRFLVTWMAVLNLGPLLAAYVAVFLGRRGQTSFNLLIIFGALFINASTDFLYYYGWLTALPYVALGRGSLVDMLYLLSYLALTLGLYLRWQSREDLLAAEVLRTEALAPDLSQ